MCGIDLPTNVPDSVVAGILIFNRNTHEGILLSMKDGGEMDIISAVKKFSVL